MRSRGICHKKRVKMRREQFSTHSISGIMQEDELNGHLCRKIGERNCDFCVFWLMEKLFL